LAGHLPLGGVGWAKASYASQAGPLCEVRVARREVLEAVGGEGRRIDKQRVVAAEGLPLARTGHELRAVQGVVRWISGGGDRDGAIVGEHCRLQLNHVERAGHVGFQQRQGRGR
jgi:hypothetical protein